MPTIANFPTDRPAYCLQSPDGCFLRMFIPEGHHQTCIRYYCAEGAQWRQTGGGYAWRGPARTMWASLKREGWCRV